MMKKLILFTILILYCSFNYGQVSYGSKLLTTADSVLWVYCQSEWLEISVGDSAAADTVLVQVPVTSEAGVVDYATIGMIKEVATNDNVTGLYGNADVKLYILWVPYPRAVRLILSDYASGSVRVKAVGKP